jgi:hypothetical protein
MKKNVQHHIDGFIDYFERQAKAIHAVSDTMHRKLLTVAMLDTLSITRFPGIPGNYKRFVTAIRALCDWKEADRLSLGQLVFALDDDPTLARSGLGREVSRRIGMWDSGQVIRIANDPEVSALAQFARTSAERKLLNAHQHVSLLYVYRCSLVHEFREPGYDMGILDDDPTPYYMGMDDELGRFRWELVYPNNFFVYVVDRALANLRAYLEANAVNPYDAYEFGSRWRAPRRG